MNTRMMSDEQLAELNGGIAPFVLLVGALVAMGGCSMSCTRTEADGSKTEVKGQVGNSSSK
jgi:lactobin A/cerein 7B family class IIb bacteriocin